MSWACPKCGSDSLDVQIQTWARLEQFTEDGEDSFSTDCDEADDCSHEWDGSSFMQCRECGHFAKVAEFVVTTTEGEPIIIDLKLPEPWA